MVETTEFDDIRSWILFHHERPDGRGYPAGLVGGRPAAGGPDPRGRRRLRGDDAGAPPPAARGLPRRPPRSCAAGPTGSSTGPWSRPCCESSDGFLTPGRTGSDRAPWASGGRGRSVDAGRNHEPAGDGADAVVLLPRRGRRWCSPRWRCPTTTSGSRGRSRSAPWPSRAARRCSCCAKHLPALAIPVVLTLGTALVTVLIWCEGDGSSFFGLFYLWVAVEAFYLLSRAGAALQVSLVAVAYGRRAGRPVPDDRPAAALADGGGRGHRGRRARGLPARQDRRARGLARRRRPHRSAHRPAQQAGVRGAVRERARAGAPLERTSIRAPRRSRRLQGRERPLRPRGRRRGAPPGGGGHAQVEAPGGHPGPDRRRGVRAAASRDRRARRVPGGRAPAPRHPPELRRGSAGRDDQLRSGHLPGARAGAARADARRRPRALRRQGPRARTGRRSTAPRWRGCWRAPRARRAATSSSRR